MLFNNLRIFTEMLCGPIALLVFNLEIIFSTSVGDTGDKWKLLHCEFVKYSTKVLLPGWIPLANIGPTEAKYLLKALAIPLAPVKLLPSTVNLFGKDKLLRSELITKAA